MNIETRVVSSLEKVFCRSAFEGKVFSKISALKGETVSFQIAMRSDDIASGEIKSRFPENFKGSVIFREVQSVPSLMPACAADEFTLTTEPGLFPDPLVPIAGEFPLTIGNWHAVWVTLQIPEDALPGTFELEFDLKFTSRYAHTIWCTEPVVEAKEHITLEIVNAVLPEQELKVTHWFYADCLQYHSHVSAWSEEHWTIIEKYFRNYVAHQNSMLLTPLWSVPLDILPGMTSRPLCQLLEISLDKGKWSFNFDRLRRWIATAQKCGVKYFEMVHAFSQWGLKSAPEIMVEVEGVSKPYFGKDTPLRAAEYKEFLTALMKEMLPVLRELGLTPENCYFHISDEPGKEALDNYRYASGLFKEILEGYPVIDALSSLDFVREGLISRPVPHIPELDEFIKEDLAERWVYYAGAWANGVPGRQFGMPSLRNRVLGVLLYVYDCKGFLEWGYNFWFGQFNRTWDVDVWRDSNSDYSFRSGGAYLVYPGPDGPIDSLRHEVIADGFRDEMALRLLESLSSREEVLKLLDETAGYRIELKKYPREDEWLLELRNKVNAKIAELTEK